MATTAERSGKSAGEGNYCQRKQRPYFVGMPESFEMPPRKRVVVVEDGASHTKHVFVQR